MRLLEIFVIAVLCALGIAASARAADAPFGFDWGQTADQLPPLSSKSVDGNITLLTYQAPHLPPGTSETDTVIARVCDRLGLQQVRWFSHIYSSFSEATDAFLDVYEEGVHKYGEANQADLDHGTAYWSAQHIRMRMASDNKNDYRILIISDGPQYDECRAEHQKLTGHR